MKNQIVKSKFMSSTNWLLVLLIMITATYCNPKKELVKAKIESDAQVEETVLEEIWIVYEHQYEDVPITSKAEKEPVFTSDKEAKDVPIAKDDNVADEESEINDAKEVEQEVYEIATLAAMKADLLEQEYEVLESTVVVTEAIVPLEETQTLVSYAKKDKNDAAIQVVSNLQTGEIEQITFVDKKHRDVYDVQAGLTGKEVKKLRKEMKHMVKKGQVFLYDDQSNIMYLMDAQNMVGDEIITADVETMEVQSIIWKDKKHHKKK